MTSSLVIVATLVLIGVRPAFIESGTSARPAIPYLVVNLAGAPPEMVRGAAEEAERIFGLGRIDLIRDDPVGRAAGQRPAACVSALRVFIIGERIFNRLSPDPEVVGFTAAETGEPGAAMVSLDRAIATAHRFRLSPSSILGDVMAHELGHLLLPRGHSRTTLMKAAWNDEALLKLSRGILSFSSTEGEMLRAAVRARSAGCDSSRLVLSRVTRVR